MDFAVSANHRVKIKENEKRDKYLDLAWELKNQWHMKVTVIPKVSILKALVKEREDLEI